MSDLWALSVAQHGTVPNDGRNKNRGGMFRELGCLIRLSCSSELCQQVSQIAFTDFMGSELCVQNENMSMVITNLFRKIEII